MARSTWYPGGRARTAEPMSPSDLRSVDMWVRSAPAALGGGLTGHRAAVSVSTETGRLAWTSSSASRVRGLAALRGISRPSAQYASSGPRTRNRTVPRFIPPTPSPSSSGTRQ